MSRDKYQRLTPGEKVRTINADLHNSTVDMVREYDAGRSFSQQTAGGADGSLRIVNLSGDVLQQFAVVGIGDPLTLPSANEPAFKGQKGFVSAAPASDAPFAILQDSARNGTTAPALMSGVTQVRLVRNGAAHGYARPIDDDYEKLESTDSATSCEILWTAEAEEEEESVWALVRLGARTCCDDDGGDGDDDDLTLCSSTSCDVISCCWMLSVDGATFHKTGEMTISYDALNGDFILSQAEAEGDSWLSDDVALDDPAPWLLAFADDVWSISIGEIAVWECADFDCLGSNTFTITEEAAGLPATISIRAVNCPETPPDPPPPPLDAIPCANCDHTYDCYEVTFNGIESASGRGLLLCPYLNDTFKLTRNGTGWSYTLDPRHGDPDYPPIGIGLVCHWVWGFSAGEEWTLFIDGGGDNEAAAAYTIPKSEWDCDGPNVMTGGGRADNPPWFPTFVNACDSDSYPTSVTVRPVPCVDAEDVVVDPTTTSLQAQILAAAAAGIG